MRSSKDSDFTEIKLTNGKYYNQKYGFTISNVPDFLKIKESYYDNGESLG